MIDGHAGKVFKCRGGNEKVIPYAQDRWIRVKTGEDGIERWSYSHSVGGDTIDTVQLAEMSPKGKHKYYGRLSRACLG
jgi:hypothetical protein